MNERFGATLKQFRIGKRLTQEQLVEKIGKSAVYIAQLERGQSYPSYQTLASLVSVLNADANVFFNATAADEKQLKSTLRQISHLAKNNVISLLNS